MNDEFKVVISSPDDASGTQDTLSSAAARTPDASLGALAASARQAQAVAEAARRPIAGLVNVPDAVLAKLETGFGLDSQAKTIGGVERVGQVFTEAAQRPPKSSEASAGSTDQRPTTLHASLIDPWKGFSPHQGTRAAANSLARLPGTVERPVRGADDFAVVPTARASLRLALAGIGTPPLPATTVAPNAPTGGQAGSTGPGLGKVAADRRPFEESTYPEDHPHSAVNQGFQTFDERLARVEQTTREHTSQIENRS